jgi:type I restriction enzyme S subunit
VTFPDRTEQEAIGSILTALDKKIELNRRMNETLEAMARAIFKDWFVDFGPTRAKMAGSKPYLAPEIWDLFPDSLDDEGKPRGWEDRTISKLADLNPESWSRANYPLEIRYVDLANTKWGTIESTELHTTETAPSRAQRIIRPGDTIIGTVRPGNGSYALIDDEGFTASTGFAVLRPKLPSHREIVYLSLTMPENIDRLSHLADGGAYPAVRPEVIAATEVMIAPSSVTLHFSDMVAPLIDRMEANKRENSTLAKMRDILLPKLMSGEIRIPDSGPTAELVLAKAS